MGRRERFAGGSARRWGRRDGPPIQDHRAGNRTGLQSNSKLQQTPVASSSAAKCLFPKSLGKRDARCLAVLIYPLPRKTAYMRSRSRSASLSRFSTSTPAPSPNAYPSPRASNVIHLPSGDKYLPVHIVVKYLGRNIRLLRRIPPGLHSLFRRLWHAKCAATSPEEHAVSRDMLGPYQSKI